MRLIFAFIALVSIFSCGSASPEVTKKVPDAVFINQEGYLPTAEKYFITNIDAESFVVLDNSGAELHSASVEIHKENDTSTGLKLYIGDFSSFTTSGVYTIKLSNGSESYPFSINEDIYNNTAKQSIKSFYFQRCGVELHRSLAGAFAHPACHTRDNTFHSTTAPSDTRSTVGGWHDAGDYGKYITPGATALAMMTIMYEQFPDRFNFDNNGIPESGNGVSDFLDEIKYELDWMLTMQNTTSGHAYEGAVNYMVNTRGYSWVMPHNDSATRYIYNYSSVATADFAAIMAQASRIFATDFPADSAIYLTAAEKAWTFLEQNPTLVPDGGFARPSDTQTGGYCEYADTNDTDDRLWAAVELFLTTEDETYHKAALKLGLASDSMGTGSWASVYSFARLQYALADSSLTDATIAGRLQNALFNFNTESISKIDNDGFRDSMTTYYWGGNGDLMLHAQLLILGGKLNSGVKDRNEKYALRLLHYILGINPFNMTFVSKVGDAYPTNIHHAQLDSDGSSDIFPGLVPGGPNQYTSEFPEGTAPGLSYIDQSASYTTNENCILYTAPLVGTAFYFSTSSK